MVAHDGSWAISAARFDSGPSVTTTTSSAAAARSSSAVVVEDGANDAGGRNVFPSPSTPWMKSAGRRAGAGPNAASAPTATGISGCPVASRIRHTFPAAVSTGTLPCTTVMATTSASGEVRAYQSAAASSTPPSVSMIMRTGIRR